MKKSQAGFSILELAIVLTVIALIVSSSLAVAAMRIAAAKVENTNNTSEVLMEILASYVKNFDQLPCPANPKAKPTDPDFGVGSVDNKGTLNVTDDDECNATNILVSGDVRIGAVPTTTLGLSYSSAVDGWNRRFTYAVDQRLTNRDNYVGRVNNNVVEVQPVPAGSIVIRSSAGGADQHNDAVMVLLSHGSNGHGAWSGKGGAARPRVAADPPLNEDEVANINPDDSLQGDLGNLANDVIFVQKPGSDAFDDMVQYKLKWQLPAN